MSKQQNAISWLYFTAPSPRNRSKLTVHVAETASLAFLCVVETASPVYSDITFVAVKSSGALHATSGTNTTEFEETVEHGAIITDIVLALFFCKRIHVIRGNLGEEVDVFVRMELGHLKFGGWFRTLW